MKPASSRSKASYFDSMSTHIPARMRTSLTSRQRASKASARAQTTPSGSPRPAKKAVKPNVNTLSEQLKQRGQRSGGPSSKKSKHAVKLRTLQEIRSSKKPTSKRQKRIRRVSIKKAADLKEYYALRSRFLANVDLCEVCHTDRPVEIHHRRGRVGPLLTDLRHLLATCHRCHQWLHENIEEARTLGYICEKGLWNTPDRS